MVCILRVLKGLEKLCVAPRSPHVLGRAGPLALDAHRIPLAILGIEDLLDHDLVPPRIAHVVDVPEPELPLARGEDLTELDLLGVLIEIRIRRAIMAVINVKIPQMLVVPAHDDLNDVMKSFQSGVGDQDPPPDTRLDILERDLDLEDRILKLRLVGFLYGRLDLRTLEFQPGLIESGDELGEEVPFGRGYRST